MILVDANLLLYAEDSLSERHAAAREWWDEQLSGSEPVAFCWSALSAFIRVSTNARLHRRPRTLKEATERVESWFQQPCARVIHVTEEHWKCFQRMLRTGNATGIWCRTPIWLPSRLSTIASCTRRTVISLAFPV